MDPASIGVLVPVVAIIVWGGAGMQKRYLQHKEDLIARQGAAIPAIDQSVISELKALKDEVARLRDTTTQYDLSIDHQLSDLDQRVRSIENRSQAYSVQPASEVERQTVGPST